MDVGRQPGVPGRVDHQVKVRGFRIELGEIESALRAHNIVSDAIVMVQERGNVKQLAAYVIARPFDSGPETDIADILQKHLRRALPAYMVPSVISVVSSWPLTPSGKVDRRALPSLSQKNGEQLSPRTRKRRCSARCLRMCLERSGWAFTTTSLNWAGTRCWRRS